MTVPASLLARLRAIVGAPHVLTQPEDVIVYERDAYLLSQSPPDAVVLPGSAEEVASVVEAAAEFNVPVVPRGAGTGLAGGAIVTRGGILLVLTRLNRILEIRPRERQAVVEAGVINADLNAAAAPHGLFYAPDPGSQTVSTVGGNIACNAGGAHCLAYGVTTNHVAAVEVALADGRLVWTGEGCADAPGYDLPGIITGSEGTLGVVTKAVLKLLRRAEAVQTLLAIYDDLDRASQTVSDLIAAGIVPAAMEMLDAATLRIVEDAVHAGYPKDAGAVLLIELEGLVGRLDRLVARVTDVCDQNGAREVRTAAAEEERRLLWKGRKEAFGALGRLMSGVYLADTVVPRHTLPAIMRRIGQISAKYEIPIANFFHAGDGNLHPNLLYDPRSPRRHAGVQEAAEEIIQACLAVGGTITGEHGVGIEKREYMRWQFSETDLDAMRRVKQAFDPQGRMNPGKVLPEPLETAGTGIREQGTATAKANESTQDVRVVADP